MPAADGPDADLEGQSRPSPAAFAKARAERPEVCGSYAPERPYPIYLRGLVERGFGRGGKDLGCPTANLPSKVIQSHPSLNRTGIYYGFARVLPQDPDDPDLVDEQEEAAESSGTSTWRGSSMSNSLNDASTVPEDDVDVQTDDDGDEVVLSASPINEEAEIDIVGAQAGNGRLANVLFKPRQLSRSSIRSSRSVKTILEQAGALKLERTTSGGSGVQGSSSEASPLTPPVTAGETTAQSQQSQSSASLSSPVKQLSPPAIGTAATVDKHPRDASAASSQAGSMRRKKKRRVPITTVDAQVFPMVMSVGWNPFYKNTTKTAEVHIMHNFQSDFYGLEMRVVVLGYIRPEYNYVSKEALIDDIEMDKKVAINSLARSPYQDYVADPFLSAPS